MDKMFSEEVCPERAPMLDSSIQQANTSSRGPLSASFSEGVSQASPNMLSTR